MEFNIFSQKTRVHRQEDWPCLRGGGCYEAGTFCGIGWECFEEINGIWGTY